MFADSAKIRLEDFTLRDAACWGIVCKCCDGVVARRVKIDSVVNVNNDGFDIEARNVLIEGCDVQSGDDVTLRNISLECVGEGPEGNARPHSIPGEEIAGGYPDAWAFAGYHLPCYGLFIDHADGVKLENVTFRLRPGTTDSRPPVADTREAPKH